MSVASPRGPASAHRRPPAYRAAIVRDPALTRGLITAGHRQRLAQLVALRDETPPGMPPNDVEILITGWGCPRLDETWLSALPSLRLVAHAAGSIKRVVTPACYERGIQVSSAAWANAQAVAEYCVAAILWAHKRVLWIERGFRARRRPEDWAAAFPFIGNRGRRVGLVGASHVGRRVAELLAPFEFELSVADPFLRPDEAEAMGLRYQSLAGLMADSDLVSVHAPDLPSTDHLIDRRLLSRMRDGATLINTARGRLVDLDALLEALRAGRLYAVIDTTEPFVLPADSPLYDLPNVYYTPHIAGSLGDECVRLMDAAIDEVERFCRGEPLAHEVRPSMWSRLA